MMTTVGAAKFLGQAVRWARPTQLECAVMKMKVSTFVILQAIPENALNAITHAVLAQDQRQISALPVQHSLDLD